MQITDIKGSFQLHNQVQIPYLGLGVYNINSRNAVIDSLLWAFDAGYRHIDTASIYGNEEAVGAGILKSGLERKELFVVSKVWNAEQGYQSTLRAFENSLSRLQLDYLDLYLVHWPVKNKFVDTWKALETLYSKGKIRTIGVSNFMQHHLEELLLHAEIVPMVNQMEFHPWLVQQQLLDFCRSKNIQYESWAPIMRGKVLKIERLKALGTKYGKTPVQIVLRWNLQKGVVTIPKSSKKERIWSNADIFDFELSPADIRSIDALDKNHRIGPDPNNFSF